MNVPHTPYMTDTNMHAAAETVQHRIIETSAVSTYIPGIMKPMMKSLILLLAAGSAAAPRTGDLEFSLEFLRNFDTEVASLLDAYLEAVPECPIREDTPVRLWVIDTAWIRTSGALETALSIDTRGAEAGFPVPEWEDYLSATGDYLEAFGTVQEAYHSVPPPDGPGSLGLEADLLRADSLWRVAEFNLYERLAEEGYHE